MDNKRPLAAHISLFLACVFWGLMAPVGKDAMAHGISGTALVTLRVAGAAALFWAASLFTARERVPGRDLVRLLFAGLLGLVFNQCCYIIGLSMTSPVNASIVTTSAPIFAMVLSALILKEPVTGKKATGVLMGFSGALILILTSARADSPKAGNLSGDLLCLFAQFSFALYLALFRPLVQRYSVFTVNKWMFTFATLLVAPFTAADTAAQLRAGIPAARVARGGLRGGGGHLPLLHTHDDGPAHAPPHRGEHLQLPAAGHVGSGQRGHGPGSVRPGPRPGRGAGVRRRVARHQIEEPRRHEEGTKK